MQDPTEFVKQTSRELWIDACKGIGILLVLLGHVSPPFMKFIYGFHMPLFFIISGYVFKKENFQISFALYLKKLLKSYLFPYGILCFVNLFLEMGRNLILHIPDKADLLYHYLCGIIYSRGSQEWMPNCSPLWFLTGLIMALLLFYAIGNRKSRKLQIIFILFCPGISYIFYFMDAPKLFWNMDTALMAVLFISIGYRCKEESLKFEKSKYCQSSTWYFFIIVLLIILGSVAIHLNPVEHVDFDDNIYGNLLCMICGALSISLGLMILCFRTIKHWNQTLVKGICYLGRHTVFFMGFDYFSGSAARQLLSVAGLYPSWYWVFGLKLVMLLVGLFLWNAVMERIAANIPNAKYLRM